MKKLICIFLFLAINASAQFPFTNIFLGTTTNDGTGDNLRFLLGKVNTNSYYLTNAIGVTSNALQASIIASNASPAAPVVTFTNWISGKLYTNVSGRPWFVQTTAGTTYATVGGAALQQLQTATQSVALVTIAQYGAQTIVGSLGTTNCGIVSGPIANGNYFSFTNSVTGSGDAAANLPGTGFWIQF